MAAEAATTCHCVPPKMTASVCLIRRRALSGGREECHTSVKHTHTSQMDSWQLLMKNHILVEQLLFQGLGSKYVAGHAQWNL